MRLAINQDNAEVHDGKPFAGHTMRQRWRHDMQHFRVQSGKEHIIPQRKRTGHKLNASTRRHTAAGDASRNLLPAETLTEEARRS